MGKIIGSIKKKKVFAKEKKFNNLNVQALK